MRHTLSFLLVFLLCLLATACAGSSSQAGLTVPTSNPTPPPVRSGLRVLLVPVAGTATPTQSALSAVQATLTQRLIAFGFKNASVHELTSGGQPALQVEVPHFGDDELAALSTLLETGQVEFWDTGFTHLPINALFDPAQFTPYNPGYRPWFTGKDLDASRVSVGTDQAGKPDINFQMKGDAVARFSQFTASHTFNFLTITLDRKVLSSAIMVSHITGPVEITGTFTRQQATAIVSVLTYPSLPVALHIGSETPW